jgi:hypothetical protein
MKVLLIILCNIYFLLNLLYARKLRSKRKREKTKENGIIFLMWAVGENYYNINETHQFFDNGQIISIINPSDENDNYTKIYTKIISDFVDNEYTDDNIPSLFYTGDLTIRNIKIYKRSFLEQAFHEFLQFCVTNDSNDELYFIIDRGANLDKLIQENSRIIKAFKVITAMEPLLQTKVRIVLTGYKKYLRTNGNNNERVQSICSDFSPEWAEFRGHRVDQDHPDSIFISSNSEYENFTVTKFEDVIKASILYSIQYPGYYLTSENCQHFATGFYNSITGENKEISNPKLTFMCRSNIDMDSIFQRIMLE